MRTSLNEIKYIERYLNKDLSSEQDAFETIMVKDYHVRVNVFLQQKIYTLLRIYKRRKLRNEADLLHERLFNAPEKQSFRESILQLF
jgi:hypothetical protein